jgi:hypothetical protein
MLLAEPAVTRLTNEADITASFTDTSRMILDDRD